MRGVRIIWIILSALSALVWAAVLMAPWGQAQAADGVPPAAYRHRAALVRAAHLEWGLSAPVAMLAAQVHAESGWRADAVSAVGARGLAQFMPATATWWCARTGVGVADCRPHNPAWALRALVGYDKYLFDRVPAHLGLFDRLWVTLRAYNGGLAHWQAEAASTGLMQPSRVQVDAACGRARRAPVHCAENVSYPARVLVLLQPRYEAWGGVVALPVREG